MSWRRTGRIILGLIILPVALGSFVVAWLVFTNLEFYTPNEFLAGVIGALFGAFGMVGLWVLGRLVTGRGAGSVAWLMTVPVVLFAGVLFYFYLVFSSLWIN